MEKNLGHLTQQSVANSSQSAWLEVDSPGGSTNKEAGKRRPMMVRHWAPETITLGSSGRPSSEAFQNYSPSPEGRKLRCLSFNSQPLSLLSGGQEQTLKWRWLLQACTGMVSARGSWGGHQQDLLWGKRKAEWRARWRGEHRNNSLCVHTE